MVIMFSALGSWLPKQHKVPRCLPKDPPTNR
jgi:hypothetical protein